MADPYTIQIHVLDGNPNGFRIINRPADWSGCGIVFPREELAKGIDFDLLKRCGVYILWDHDQSSGELYIGQSEVVSQRISEHNKSKKFWKNAIAFTSENNILNAGHIRWLEYNLIQRIKEIGSRSLTNQNTPSKPSLSLQDESLSQVFLKRMLEIFPLIGLSAFETPSEATYNIKLEENALGISDQNLAERDTVIVPTGKTGQGFEEVFLGSDCWYSVRLSEKSKSQLKYIAAYRPSPESAVTHFAKISSIEPYGEGNDNKYKIIFAKKADKIKDIPFGTAKIGAMQSPRYVTKDSLLSCEDLGEIL